MLWKFFQEWIITIHGWAVFILVYAKEEPGGYLAERATEITVKYKYKIAHTPGYHYALL